MKKFVNDPMNVVDEMLEGFLFVNQRYVRRASGHPRHRPHGCAGAKQGRRHYRRRFQP